ncbi:MAG: hypothetical protein D6798_17235, partial [Deltaproteobacteria bacterium]
MHTLAVLAIALSSARPARADPLETSLGVAGGWFADTPAAGVALETTAGAAGPWQARFDGSLLSRVPRYAGTTPLAGYAELELTAALRLSPADRLGLSLTGELMATGTRDQDCSPGLGCRWNTTAEVGPALLIPNWAPGLRWARRTARGGGLNLGVAPQLVWHYDMGVPLLRIDLDV